MLKTWLQQTKEFLKPVVDNAILAKHRVAWRQHNAHNNTSAGTVFPIEKVSVGPLTYGVLNLHFFNDPAEEVRIGALCSIADNVDILAGGEHSLDWATTFPLRHYLVDATDMGSHTRGPVVIGDDVWIGRGVTILSGVTIGQGAVIGSGSVVHKDIPAYAIYAAGRVVRYRFDEDVREALQRIDWSRIPPSELRAHLESLAKPVDQEFLQSELFRSATQG